MFEKSTPFKPDSRGRRMRDQSRILRLLHHFWTYKLTFSGRLLFSGATLALLMSWSSLAVPAFQMACALASLFLIQYITGYLFRPRLEIHGKFPRKASADHTLGTSFRVTNRSRLATYDICLAFFDLPASIDVVNPSVPVCRLASGATVQFPLSLTPHRRGLYPLPNAKAFTTFPFNLCRTATREPAGDMQMLVLPGYHELRDVSIPAGSRYQPRGIIMTSRIGESPEYVGNRDYHPGDPMRHIDFRAWARVVKPVVREFREEYFSRVALAMDTFVGDLTPDRTGGYAELEAGVSLVASIADAMMRGEHIVDILAAGPQLYQLRTGRHTTPFESILEILACVEACPSDPFDALLPALEQELEHISAVVCVLLDWDDRREKLVRAAVEAGCSVTICIVRNSETTSSLAGAYSWSEAVHVFTPETILKGLVNRI
jgi:uncharacterized protein (DUF58 family)